MVKLKDREIDIRISLLSIAKDLVLSKGVATHLKEVFEMVEVLERWVTTKEE